MEEVEEEGKEEDRLIQAYVGNVSLLLPPVHVVRWVRRGNKTIKDTYEVELPRAFQPLHLQVSRSQHLGIEFARCIICTSIRLRLSDLW